MSYKKKVHHIKGNEAKPYNAQLIRENRAKTNTTPHHHTLGEESTIDHQSKHHHSTLFHANTGAARCKPG